MSELPAGAFDDRRIDEPVALTRRHLLAVWIVLSAAAMCVGAVAPWFTVSTVLGGISLSGTYIGSNAGGEAFGAGWEILGAAAVATPLGLVALFAAQRWAYRFGAAAAALAIADAGYVMVRSTSALFSSSQYATAAWGWGLILALLAATSLFAALVTSDIISVSKPTALTAVAGLPAAGADSRRPRGRTMAALSVLAAIAIACAVGEAALLVREQSRLEQTRSSLRTAQDKVTSFPSQLREARATSYSSGVDDGTARTQGRYAGCYATAYSDGYLQGWNAAVGELNATGNVKGGGADSWWDPTTYSTCDTA